MNQTASLFEKYLDRTKHNLNGDDIGAILAGFNDIIRSVDTIKENVHKIYSSHDTDEIKQLLEEIQYQLVFHIKAHIDDMDEPLLKLINTWG